MSGRRYDLDWLRVVATGAIFVYHCLGPFAGAHFYVVNAEQSQDLFVVATLLTLWMMPVFFVISGRVMLYSLGHEDAWALMRSRFFRLIVPFLFGVFFLAPIVIYIQRVTTNAFSGSLLSFYLDGYFHGLQGFGGNFAFLGIHLWYLLYLFLFTAVVLLLVWVLRVKSHLKVFHDRVRFFQQPGALFVLSIPIILAMRVSLEGSLVLSEIGLAVTRFFFFSYGILFAFDPRFDPVIDHHWKTSAVLAALFIPVYAWVLSTQYAVDLWLEACLVGVASFTLVIALFGAFHAMANRSSKRLGGITEGILPFYILHFPVIIIVGYYVTPLGLGIYPKVALLICLSLPIIIVLYLIIKRVTVLRFLFGMKISRKRKQGDGTGNPTQ